jgi:hypothetical protein
MTGVSPTESTGTSGQSTAAAAAHSGTITFSIGKNRAVLEPSGVFNGALATIRPLKPSQTP